MPDRTSGPRGGPSNRAPAAATGGQRTPSGRPVALFIPSLDAGGAERVMLEVALLSTLEAINVTALLAKRFFVRDTLDDPVATERLIARAGHYSSAAASMARHLELLHWATTPEGTKWKTKR